MIYIIFDTALNGPYTLMLLQNAYPVNQSLFKGTKDEALSDVAPYIFQVDDHLFEKINHPIASLKFIVVFESDQKINNLLSHFQQFIYEKRNGQENYFRFWDARVLERFLPTCSEKKLDIFFENIAAYYIVDETEATARCFTINRRKLLNTKIISLKEIFALQNISAPLQEQTNESNLTSTGQPVKQNKKFFSN